MPIPIPELIASLQQLQRLQQEKQYPQLAEALSALLVKIFFTPYGVLPPQEEKLFGLLGKLILKIFADPQFLIPERLVFDYINCTVLISNLVRLSEFRNSDLILKSLLESKAPVSKILPLYSFRNTVTLDMESVFNHQPALAFGWMTMVLAHGSISCCSAEGREWMRRLLALKALRSRTDFLNRRYYYQLMMCSSYIDPDQDRPVRTAVNKAFRAKLPALAPLKTCKPGKVLVVSSCMAPGHAVYKSMSPLISALSPEYEVVLIAPPAAGSAKGGAHPDWQFNVVMPRIRKEEAEIIIYPDISLDLLSVELSNVRLAPIQLTMYGHPVSSFAAEIDYFIASQEAELIEDIEENYSERAVLLPGLAAISVAPDYALSHPKRHPSYAGKVIINCAWGSMKMNDRILLMLREALKRSRSDILFRFTDIKGDYLSFSQVLADVREILGREHVECIPPLPYREYMRMLEDGDFAVDSYPFCGYNRTVDTLFCGKPIVALEGRKIYNRFGAAILRRIGLPELAASDEERFIETIVRLADDAAYREEMAARVKAADLRASLCQSDDAAYFKKAVDYLRAHHQALQKQKSRAPIVVPAI